MLPTISQIDDAEFRLVDLIWKLSPGELRDDCERVLKDLRVAKTSILARYPEALRKGVDTEKRTHAQARDQRLHDALRDASGGHVCASYRAKMHSGAVDTSDRHMHELHHSLVNNRGVKCDAVSIPGGGMPNADGESEDKAVATRAAGLAKRLGMPVPRPAGPTTFYWQVEGARMGLDMIERGAETDRINRYRQSQGLVPLT
jgi:hypothetical protein